MKIRPYTPVDETGWLHCRVLAFLTTAYFDDVETEKPTYENPSIELVAESNDGKIIGFIDVECEQEAGTICGKGNGLGGMIWHIGVHPDHQRQGIAKNLLNEAITLAKLMGIERFEAWTRDDPDTLAWYKAVGFAKIQSYLHVYLSDEEAEAHFKPLSNTFYPIKTFAHFTDPTQFDQIRAKYTRVHDCTCFELPFT